jgi:hypothetical protein
MALDQHVSELLAFLKQAGAKSFELMDIQEFRGAVGSSVGMQKPPQEVAKVHSVPALPEDCPRASTCRRGRHHFRL